MPRLPREKTKESIFHVMVRSIKEVPLFREDKDKEQYMNILKGYQKIYGLQGTITIDMCLHVMIKNLKKMLSL